MRLPLAIAVFFLAGCSASHPKAAVVPQPKAPERTPTTDSLEVYFVRHGETVSNATGRYDAMGLNKLSDKGMGQIKVTAAKLKGIAFDAIIVSPSERALRTAFPIVENHRTTATVWPELNECCTQHGSARKAPPSPNVKYEGLIHVPADMAADFRVDPGHDRAIANGNYQDGERQIKMAADRFLQTYGGKPVRILVVGHAASGSRFLDLLLGRPPIGDIEIKNASVTVLKQSKDGKFKLVSKFAP